MNQNGCKSCPAGQRSHCISNRVLKPLLKAVFTQGTILSRCASSYPMKIDNVTLTTFGTDALDGGFIGIRSLAEIFFHHPGQITIFHLNFFSQCSGPHHLFQGFLFGFTLYATPGNRSGLQARQCDFITAIFADSIFTIFDVFQ